jgi:hypothetical protein
MPSSKSKQPPSGSHLVVSDDQSPSLKLKAGMKFEVHAVTLVDADLKPAGPVAARLCGGTSTCLALIELE